MVGYDNRERSSHDRDRGDRDRYEGSRYERSSRRDYESRGHRSSRDNDRGRIRDSRDSRDNRDNRDRHYERRGRDDHHQNPNPNVDVREKRRRDTSPKSAPARKKRKSSLWDDVPEGLDGLTQQEVCQHLAQNVPLPGAAPTLGLQYGMPGNPINTPFTQAKRLYVGNVPPTATEEDLKQFFRHQYISANFAKGDTEVVQSVQIKYDRNFAFIELDDAEMATKGLGFDGISFQQHTLKVRRPRDYQGPEVLGDVTGFIPGIVSTNVPDTPNKVFVGGLPSALSEEQVKELIGYFGELKAFHLVKDSATNVSKGFAFFEYLDATKTDTACRALNGKEIAGKNLLVQRAHLGSRSINQTTTFELGNSESVLGCLLNLAVPVTTTLHNNDLSASPEPTSVLVLLNMISYEDLLNKEERDILTADVERACAEFGPIKKIHIPFSESEEELERVKGVGKVFVQFHNAEHSQACQKATALRKYNNRCVLTSFLEEELFLGGYFDGKEDAGNEEVLDKLQKQIQNETALKTERVATSYHTVPPPRM